MPERGTAVWSRLLAWAERFGNIWSFISGLGVISVGGLTAWAAWAADLLAQFAPFSWVAAGILGAFLMSLILLAVGIGRLKLAQAGAARRWEEKATTVNPLETTFRNQRINIADLISPIDGVIRGKTFIECELIGPANLMVMGSKPGSAGFSGVAFSDCDWIVVKEQGRAFNAAILLDCTFVRGIVHRATFYFPGSAGMIVKAAIPQLVWLTEPPNPPAAT